MFIQLNRPFVGRRPGEVFRVLIKAIGQDGRVNYLIRDIELHARVDVPSEVVYLSPHFNKQTLLRENGKSYRAAWVSDFAAEETSLDVSDNEQAITYRL